MSTPTQTPEQIAAPKAARKPLQVNPVKLSQPVGATLAFLGVRGCLPLMHGAIGCASFTKVMLTRHFNEPVALRNTAVTEVATVLDGGDQGISEAVRNLLTKVQPEFIGLFSTGLTDAKGDDLRRIARDIDYPTVTADTPDFKGGLESGWATVATAFIEQMMAPGEPDPTRLLLLPHVSLHPLEVERLKEFLADWGYRVDALPDLSTSLDGHLNDQDQSAMTRGGIRPDEIRALGRSGVVVSVGASMQPVAEAFLARSPGARHLHLPGIMGLVAGDELVAQLMELTGREPGERVKRWRQRLQDVLIDAHFTLGHARFILAGEPDRIADMARALAEAGAHIRAVIASTPSAALAGLPADEVLVGDLEDAEQRIADCDALLCNFHGEQLARMYGKVHIGRGYPILEQIGVQLKVDTLYEGGTSFLAEATNALVTARAGAH